MDLSQAQKDLARQLTPLYGDREAAAIADWVMEHLTGLKKLDRLVRKTEQLRPETLTAYKKQLKDLLAGLPVQYVLGESWFGGLRFEVDERVLIPRPETEELVEWVAAEISATALGSAGSTQDGHGPLLDVGAGSGCIAITLAKKLPTHEIHAIDVSNDALTVARQNAANLGANVQFHHLDFLDRSQWQNLPPARVVVSNPPYIPLKERASMAPHVTNAEPALALFVPNEDALLFYRALGEFSRQLPGRILYVEIHEDLAAAVGELLKKLGAKEITVRKDMQEKDRMVKAKW